MADPKPLQRQELARFLLNDNRAIKAFEGIFDVIPGVTNDLIARVEALENPGVALVSVNYQAVIGTYAVLMTATGKIITLPKAAEAIKGRTWRITLGVTGTLTVQVSAGDSFPVPSSETETQLIYTQRGETYDFLCTSTTTWAIV